MPETNQSIEMEALKQRLRMNIPIQKTPGVALSSTDLPGIARATVDNPRRQTDLSWDRFVRLKAVAAVTTGAKSILDVGGYDGALAIFSDANVDVIDPATTGGSVMEIPANNASYDAVVAVDLIEHIDPKDRSKVLSELARVARHHVILNYPCRDSREAQCLALKLTGNSLIREHVQWELPDSNWVLDELAKNGFRGTMTAHTSIAVWLGQYVVLQLLPEQAKELNRHLVANYAFEPTSKALYHLVVCERE